MNSAIYIDGTSQFVFAWNAMPAQCMRTAADPGKIAIGVIIGRSSEFFDFFVYGIASVLVFPARLLPHVRPSDRDIAVLCGLLAGLHCPPDRHGGLHSHRPAYGRGTKLIVALFVLGGSTACHGLPAQL